VRSDREFITEYRSTLRRIDPSAESMPADASRTLALTEICLRFLSRFLPNENILTVPQLMMGYPSLLDSSTVGREAVKALAILRHFAAHFGSAPCGTMLAGAISARRKHSVVSISSIRSLN